MTETTRRGVLVLAGGAGAAGVLAACGGGGSNRSGDPPGAGAGGASGGGSGGAATPLTGTGAIPVGGGKVFPEQKVVVTQPTAGQFKAFTAVCTHMGCTVGSVSGGTINCPCHGSMYSIVDGSVKGGPAPRPLAPEAITVHGTQISLAG